MPLKAGVGVPALKGISLDSQYLALGGNFLLDKTARKNNA